MSEKHELVRADDTPDLMTLGKLLASSGYFRDAQGQAQAVVKVLAGRELGLPPIASMTGIHIVEGKPTLGSNLYASFIRKHPHYDYRVKEASRTACEVVFLRGKTKDAEVLGTYRMTLKEATESGLTHGAKGMKHNWKAHPDAMLFARVISQGTRIYCPDVFDAHTVYTPEELEGGDAKSVEDVKAVDIEFEVKPNDPEPDERRATPEQVARILELATEAGIPVDQFNERLQIDYGTTRLDDLHAPAAAHLLGRLEKAAAKARAAATKSEAPPQEPTPQEPQPDDRRPADAPAAEWERGGPTEGTDRRAGSPPPAQPQRPAAPPQGGPQPGPARPRAGAPAFGGGGR